MRSLVLPELQIDDAKACLNQHFGLTEFRAGQFNVISSVYSGRNTVVIMPTGSGKSLCYQLPAVLLPGTTVVVSPLIALMKDQVEQLTARGISATFINSTLSDTERHERHRKLRAGEYKLVYVAPERFRSENFVQALIDSNLALFAIDEAHCISQWGHDFRPDYAALGQVRKKLRPARTIALTATATPEVRADIARMLLLKDPHVFVAGFDRPNLHLDVVTVSGDEDKRRACLSLLQRGSGLVYCSTRKQAESFYRFLKDDGAPAVLYHAGLTDAARRKAHDTFMSKRNAVAVATNAFGMGIDKPDIRFVVHAGIPRAVEAYYQEIGRAGRDGGESEAVLLFNHADVFTQERLIASSFPAETLLADVWNVVKSLDIFDREAAHLAVQVGASEFETSAALKTIERLGIATSVRSSSGRGLVAQSKLPWSKLEVDLTPIREQERVQRLLLKRMTDYAYSRRCRRSYLLAYFGDAPENHQSCQKCDICSGSTLKMTARAKPPIHRKVHRVPHQNAKTRKRLGLR